MSEALKQMSEGEMRAYFYEKGREAGYSRGYAEALKTAEGVAENIREKCALADNSPDYTGRAIAQAIAKLPIPGKGE